MKRKLDFSICIRCMMESEKVDVSLNGNHIGERFFKNAPWVMQITRGARNEGCGIPLDMPEQIDDEKLKRFWDEDWGYCSFEKHYDNQMKELFRSIMSRLAPSIERKCMTDVLFNETLFDGNKFKDICPYYMEHLMVFWKNGGRTKEEKT